MADTKTTTTQTQQKTTGEETDPPHRALSEGSESIKKGMPKSNHCWKGINKVTGEGTERRQIVHDFYMPITALGSQHDHQHFQLRRVIENINGTEIIEKYHLRLDKVWPNHSNGIVDIFWGGPYLNMPMKNNKFDGMPCRIIVNKNALNPLEEAALINAIESYVIEQRLQYDKGLWEEFILNAEEQGDD